MKDTRLILLHALTPLHVGTGQAVGKVDLPIAREKATGFPPRARLRTQGHVRFLCVLDAPNPDWANFAKEMLLWGLQNLGIGLKRTQAMTT